MQQAGAAPVKFRALPLSELLDETFRVYRKFFAVLAGVSVAVVIPPLVINLLAGIYTSSFSQFFFVLRNFSNPAALEAASQQPPEVNVVGLVISYLATLILLPVTLGAVYRASTQVIQGQPATVVSVLLDTIRRYFPLLAMILIALLLALSAIFIITIPIVVWVAVRWLPALPAFYAEGTGPVQSLRRGWDLTGGQWWRTLGVLLVVAIMVSIIQSALGILFVGLASVAPGLTDQTRSAAVGVISTLVGAVINPLQAIAVTLLYFDLRVRKEGLDLEQLARATSPPSA